MGLGGMKLAIAVRDYTIYWEGFSFLYFEGIMECNNSFFQLKTRKQ